MTEQVKELLIKRRNGVPTIEIVVGFALFATYKIKLWDKTGKNPSVIGNGISGDAIDDEFKVGAITSLDKRYLSWKAVVAGFEEEGSQEQNHVTVLIRQKGKTVPNGVFTYSGILEKVKTIGGLVKLKVS